MVVFAISEKKNAGLREMMEALGIRETDLEERFVRSSGKGGQKVNKTSSCVYLKHLPTGTAVKCLKDRSQSVNRYLARRELVEKIGKGLGYRTAGEAQRLALRRQKKRRRRRSRQTRTS